MPMNPHSLELLEYESLLRLLARYTGSPLGRQLVEQARPSSDRQWLDSELAAATEALDYTRSTERATGARDGPVRLRFTDLPDTGGAAERLRIEGSVLDSLEIYSLIALLERASEIRGALLPAAEAYPRLSERAARIGEFRPLLRELAGKILPDGAVADDASVALARIRRDIERQRKQIEESLDRFVRTHREDGVLQEEFVTVRNDRFVIPVIPGAKKRVPGVIHGASGSGHTLFLEPMETIELNNDLVRLNEEEMREVHRILREMTARLREHAGAIREAARVLGELDYAFAKARFAVDFDAVIPRFSNDEQPRLVLRRARHPLLQDVLRRQNKPIVPISLSLDSDARTLLISGPNTGGKTVAMKTAGLLALMAQSALPVPAEEAEFPVFDEVLADIGDEQSIEQSLSSFSAHIVRLKEMVESVTPRSLVLLDELGRATDPEEGGALGVAALEEFRQFGAFTLASTHLLPLKVYGAGTPGVLNASMGFNEDTLAPTYVLRTGMPGKSAGLDIATRLGLPAHMIERARNAMSTRERDLARLLNQLEQRLTEAAAQVAENARASMKLVEREQALEKEAQRQQAQKLKEMEQRAAEAVAQFEAQTRQMMEALAATAEKRKDAEKLQRQAARIKREFEESVQGAAKPKAPPPALPEIREGVRVRLRDVREAAVVRRVHPNGRLDVDLGMLTMQIQASDVVEILQGQRQGPRLPAGVTFTAGPRWDTLTREINVIGKTADEAIDVVDKFLDTALLAEVARIRVVHGHGHGVLRKALGGWLAKHPAVEKFYPASPQEGGTGATIVELKGG